MRTFFVLTLLTAFFCIVRLYIPTHPVSAGGSYTALAHVFVGLLIGMFIATPSDDCLYKKAGVISTFSIPRKAIYLLFIIILCGVELFAFLSSR